MIDNPAACYRAYASRDPRFDGVFYIGVTSTGIYCRPVCPARTPRAANCRFFESAEAAEREKFRPCLRCRPELAPGNAPVDDGRRIAALLVSRIDRTTADGEPPALEDIAEELGYSSRQVRRVTRQELGASPIELLLTRRLLLAKQLLTDTSLPVTRIAFASGFASLRRFNDAFRRRYGMPPSHLRRKANGTAVPAGDRLTLQLGYRPPFDWDGLLRFLAARALHGAELVDHGVYLRTVQLGTASGTIAVRHEPERRALMLELTHSLLPVLPALLDRVRNLFDLTARPDLINPRLAGDPRLAPLVARNPGLRVPGAFDSFEIAMRAILGQQVTVKGASTLAARVIETFGQPVATDHPELTHLAPTAERISTASVDQIAALGVVRTRAASIVALARELSSGRLRLEPGVDPDRAVTQLLQLPGVGPWTAHYIAMRVLRWPDAFPREDKVLRDALGGVSPREAERLAEPWRPWRSYAALHLWRSW